MCINDIMLLQFTIKLSDYVYVWVFFGGSNINCLSICARESIFCLFQAQWKPTWTPKIMLLWHDPVAVHGNHHYFVRGRVYRRIPFAVLFLRLQTFVLSTKKTKVPTEWGQNESGVYILKVHDALEQSTYWY